MKALIATRAGRDRITYAPDEKIADLLTELQTTNKIGKFEPDSAIVARNVDPQVRDFTDIEATWTKPA